MEGGLERSDSSTPPTTIANNLLLIASLLAPRRFNGYMGVGIAYPRNSYDLKGCEVDVLADREKWHLDGKPPPKPWWSKALGWMGSFTPKLLKSSAKPLECPFELASRRSNVMVTLHLSPPFSPSSSFAISTYHMPCAFRTPQMMALHSSLSVRNIQQRAEQWGTSRYVLAGDFNLKPDSGLYKMITTGQCPKDDKEVRLDEERRRRGRQRAA